MLQSAQVENDPDKIKEDELNKSKELESPAAVAKVEEDVDVSIKSHDPKLEDPPIKED